MQWDVLRDRYVYVCVWIYQSPPSSGLGRPSLYSPPPPPKSNNKELHINQAQLQVKLNENPNVKNMWTWKKVLISENSRKQAMTNDLRGIPLTSSHCTKYTSLHHYLNNTRIHTNTSTGICLSTVRQNKTHITDATKRPVSTLVSFLKKMWGKAPLSRQTCLHLGTLQNTVISD